MADTTILDQTDNLSPTLPDSYIPIEHSLRGTERISLDRLTGAQVVIANSEDDLPDAVSTVRTLADNTAYCVTDQFSTSDTLVFGSGTVIFGFGPRVSKITYTGSGTFLTVTDATATINRMGFDCPSGTFISADSTGLANQFVTIESSRLDSCVKIGSFDDISLNISNFASLAHDDGISLSGTMGFCIIEGFSAIDSDAGSVALDLGTTTISNYQMRRSTFVGTGTAIDGAASSANITAGAIATMRDVNFNNITTALSTITRTDVRWEFKSCQGVLDSERMAEADLTTTETVTISSTSVYAQVAGTNWSTEVAESFSITTGGSVTHLGEITRRFYIGVTATLDKTSGGADEICMRIGIDTGGGFVTESRTTACTQNATPTSVYCHGTFELDEDDVVGVFVANNSTTGNIDVDVSSLIIMEL